MHRIFKKLRRYFPDPLGIRESFREIAAWRKRVNGKLFKITSSNFLKFLAGTLVIYLAGWGLRQALP